MGKRVGKWAKVWIEGYHLSTDLNNVTPSQAYDELEVSGFGQDKMYLPGKSDAAIEIGGFFTTNTSSTHNALKDQTSSPFTEMLVTCAIGANATPAIGDPTFGLLSKQFNYNVVPDSAGFIAVSGTFKGGEDSTAAARTIEYGTLLADATITATGNQSSYDSGASSSNGGTGYLHITGTSAGDTITVKIQDSTDDAAWDDLITFTLDGTAIAAERVEVTGTVNRYIRAEYTVTGSDISFPIAVTFARNT